ncbi:MAG: 4-hydroxy-tetrahydrodipicolinate synthase [Pseudomonadales bacterium]|nr:4-hydroxy-tetrahydrodipicolinate synthase [Pseudomonadales bacterium]
MITGSLVALVTPMNEDGQVDWHALEQLVEWHIEQGTNAIVSMGTTGESATFAIDEHVAVMQKTIDTAAGRVPVIAGTGANSTSEAIELTAAAAHIGADAALLVTPYYNKPTQHGLYLHHKAIAEACDIAQILYNVPGRTACDMQAETVAELALIDNIVGIKEATGDIARGAKIRALCDDGFALYSGDDATFLELMKVGAVGNISVTANIAAKKMADICALALAGQFAEAQQLNQSLLKLHDDLFVEANPIPVKWAMTQTQQIQAGIRLPLTPLSKTYHARVLAAIEAAGL